MVHGRRGYMALYGPRRYGGIPDTKLRCSRPSRSSLVYTGFTGISSAVMNSSPAVAGATAGAILVMSISLKFGFMVDTLLEEFGVEVYEGVKNVYTNMDEVLDAYSFEIVGAGGVAGNGKHSAAIEILVGSGGILGIFIIA